MEQMKKIDTGKSLSRGTGPQRHEARCPRRVVAVRAFLQSFSKLNKKLFLPGSPNVFCLFQ